ncbi:MAG: nucleotide exchange factor GrpE [Kiloniellales bacterium]|nr:nucleotide exchange factor GrpE [Kiloniellales bacterium]
MSDRKPNGAGPEAESDVEAKAAEATEAEAQEPAAETAEGEAADILIEEESGILPESETDPVAELEAEVASLKDQLLRSMAEVENVRRRTRRERDEAIKYAAAPLIKDLLGVADNLARALESVPKEDEANEALAPLVAGLKLTEKELVTAFERHNIVKIEPLGERLDPHRHEAMFEIPDPSQPAGVIAQVVQAGYLLHDRLLRPARVGVTKGGPAAAASSEEDPADEAQPEPEAPSEPGSHVDTEA